MGNYASLKLRRGSTARNNECLLDFLMLTLAVGIIGMILVIGGIELNPGPYPCRLCSTVPETIASSIRHQREHAVKTKDFTYHCPSQKCSYYTLSYGALNFHVSSKHRFERHVDPSATAQRTCPYGTDAAECAFSTTSLHGFVQHLCQHLEQGTNIECAIDSCSARTKTFSTKQTFRTHLSQHHKNWRAEGCIIGRTTLTFSANLSQPTVNVPDAESSQANAFEEEDGEYFDALEDLLNDDQIYDSIGRFYLHLYSEFKLPQTYIQEVCDSVMSITEVNHARIKLILSKQMKKLDIEENTINLLCHEMLKADLLYTSHHKNAPGPSLTSHHLRKEYFKKRFGYQAPETVPLDEQDPEKTLQYVSIKQTLQRLFEDPSIQKEIDESFIRRQKESTNEVSDYTDGNLYKSENHPAREINLFLNQDTFNPVLNALGSAKNKFKSLVMYFTLGNFQPYVRSKIITKFMVMMIRESTFKAVGAKKCLSKLMEELKDLEITGMIYKGEWIKVTVQYMLGDSLGQHLIAGFIESFSGKYFCRFCDIIRSVFLRKPTKKKPRRSIDDYNRCVVEASTSDKSCKGIKAGCEFNCLKYFHATTHLPNCIAHDLFEGVVSWDLSGIIERFVKKKKWFTYKLLNRRIKNFRCHGIDIPNKPAFVRDDGKKLGGHAIQNWTLLRLFGLIIGDKIQDYNDPGWLLYLQLKELCEFYCAPSFLKTDVPYVNDVLLPQYFELRAQVLTKHKHRLRPKHHFMSHICQLMLDYGPVLYLWTLPYEQKHKFFKEVMRMTRNFINPEFSCAERQQMYFCYTTISNLLEDGFVERGSQRLTPQGLSGNVAAFVGNLPGIWNHTLSVVANGIEYHVEDMLLLGRFPEDSTSISVGFIKVIAMKERQLFFILEQRQATYIQGKGLYELNFDIEAGIVMIDFKALRYPVPHPTYSDKRGDTVFSLKFSLLPEAEESDEEML